MGTQRVYTGHGGQLAVMAELLVRQVNAAVPHVDLGTDLFAFREGASAVLRLQVKTAQGEPYATSPGYSAQFSIPLAHLNRRDKPEVVYVLVARVGGAFVDFLLVSRADMQRFRRGNRRFGTVNNAAAELALHVQFRPDEVRCGQVELTAYRNAWDRLALLRPPSVGPAADGNGQT